MESKEQIARLDKNVNEMQELIKQLSDSNKKLSEWAKETAEFNKDLHEIIYGNPKKGLKGLVERTFQNEDSINKHDKLIDTVMTIKKFAGWFTTSFIAGGITIITIILWVAYEFLNHIK